MTSLQAELTIDFPVPTPFWADAWGEDEYGVYADFEFDSVVQRMRYIAPCRFEMGSPKNEAERIENELLHTVELSEGYWLADTACTQTMWRAVMGSNPSRFKDDADGDSDERPVENVSWDDCAEFLARINKEAPERNLRLPTEAEWENACRATTTTPFSVGENITPEQVNYNGNYPYKRGKKGTYREKTVTVKEFVPNLWGLYQMHGNVWEWCSDWYGKYDWGLVKDPKGPLEGKYRVLRGGSWYSDGGRVRSALRLRYGPDYRNGNYGFRLARGQ